MSAFHDLAVLGGLGETKEKAALDLIGRGARMLHLGKRATRLTVPSYGPRKRRRTMQGGGGVRDYSQKRGRFVGGYTTRGAVTVKSRRKKAWRKKKGYRPKRLTYRKVKKMIRTADEDDSVNTYRNLSKGQESANANECYYTHLLLNAKSQLDSATDNTTVQYINAGVPALQVVDLNDHTTVDSAKINFHRTQAISEIRNNWSVPVHMHVYKLFCRESSGTSPMTRFDTDMKAKGITTPLTDVRFYLYDAQQTFKRYWKIYSRSEHLLLPGEEITLSLKRNRPFKYDPTEANQYIKGITQALVIRIQGVVAHDSTSTADIGYQAVRYDRITREIYRFTAEIDRNFKYVIPAADTSLDDETGGFVTNNMDVEQNVRG